jgi:single-stranded-DNA-specific exonuclease
MSLKSRREWVLPKKKTTDVVEYILKKREIKDTELFLNPNIKDIPPFKKLYDAKSATKEIIKHIKKGSKIVIHGDYDADGICASSLLWEFLYRDVSKFLKKDIDVIPYIPDRMEQGYGLTKGSLNDLVELGANLVITVDCGVRDKELINEFNKEKGLEFIITDHHQPPKDILEDIKYPLVHQMYPEKEYPFTEISGTAVIYLLIQSLRTTLGMDEDLEYGLDLVALSTVTDVMPLIDVNRVFVKLGLEKIRKGKRLGLRMLALRAGIDYKDIDTYHLGYILGPRINAAGRIASPMDAVRLLVSNDENLCKDISNKLENTNFERQKMTSEILESAREMVKDSKENLLFILGTDWHEGIIGLVAGKLQEQYYKPVIVATNNNGIVKASARSIKGFNITKALEKYSKYLQRYGGHELAAGFTAKEDDVVKLKKDLIKYANEKIKGEDLVPKLNVDLLLDTDDISIDLVKELQRLEPLGFGNPKPYVCIEGVEIKKKNVIGKEENHLKLSVKGNSIEHLILLMFGCDEDVDTLKEGDHIDIVGYPDINVWNGNESIQFNVREWRFSK